MKSILISLFLSAFAARAADLNTEVSETAKLRQEVELLSLEVENLKKAQQAEIDVYIQRHQEVSAQILKEKFRQDQLKAQIKLGQDKLATYAKGLKVRGSETWITSFWSDYEKSLASAHPLFSNRLRERIEKLKVELAQKKISYEHALLQTWFVLESDLAKSQEAEFILSPLEVKGELHHVEMVRFGRTKGYFRTAQGKYGELFFDQDWALRFFDDSTSKERIETLLSQFKQQQKTGLHRLPGIKL
jgi:hypothetical protein